MKRGLFYICVLLIIFVLFASCNNQNSNSSFYSSASNASKAFTGDENSMSSLEQSLMDEQISKDDQILSKTTNAPFSKLITKKYAEQLFFSSGFLFWRYNPVVSFQYTMRDIEGNFPVECLRKNNVDNVYSIYKTAEGGLVYCFYTKESYSWILHHASYLKNTLTKKEFSDLKKGNSIEDVAKIDLAFSSINDYNSKMNFNKEKSIHLLKDSLLVIDYEEKDQGMIIKSLTFYDDYKYLENGVVYNYQILEQDYIS